MQDFQDNEENKLNSQLAAIFDFTSSKFVMGYPCLRTKIVFYIHGPAIFLSFLVT